MRLTYLHWTKNKGIGGKILGPEDFIVKEVIDNKFLRKFSRGKKGVQEQGTYFLYLLKKENMTTKLALQKIAREFRIKESEIGYAGLKDKFAVTEQYITLKRNVGSVQIGSRGKEEKKPDSYFLS